MARTKPYKENGLAIEFINHACVIIDTGTLRILCDPWLTGTVFDRGWNLLVETKQTINDLNFSHIWISHEHPDHFSPLELKSLVEARRRRTPLFYQKTKDRKVKQYCESLGYPVTELAPFERYSLDDRVTVMCNTVAGYDSWLYLECPEGKILNLNDCRLRTRYDLESIRAEVGEIDLMLTQFGYANWVGNSGDFNTPHRAAEKTFYQIKAQCTNLSPRYVLPFASFIWFSHRENTFWNKTAIRIGDAVTALKSFGIQPIVMFPGDRWPLNAPADNSTALSKWQDVYSSLDSRALNEDAPVSVDELRRAFQDMQKRLQDRNDWSAILELKREGSLPSTLIYLTDHQQALAFDITAGLTATDTPRGDCDIRLGSASFAYVLRHEWGRGTVTINGRFEANYATLWRFFRQTQITYANNIGKYYPTSLTKDDVLASRSYILELLNGQ